MSAEEQVPRASWVAAVRSLAVTDDRSTALTPAATEVAAVQRPAGTASSGQDPSIAALNSELANNPAVREHVEEMRSDIIISGAFDQRGLDRILPKLAALGPQYERLIRARDEAGIRSLGERFKQQLLDEGEDPQRIQWAEEALARSQDRAQQNLFGSSAIPASPALVDEMRALNVQIADPGSAYWYSGMDPKRRAEAERLQARWRELYAGGVRGDALPPTSIEKIDARIGEIEHLIRDPRSDYHRGPNAALIQREYRELIDQRQHALQRR